MSDWLVGIDLGTTHTVVACARADGRGAARADAIRVFEIEQLVAPGEVAARPLLPSLRYHPADGELPPGSTTLPWGGMPADAPDAVVGEIARRLGADVPGRLVASAKSWLSHAGVDRLAPILPWGAPDGVTRVSPVQASAGTLAHVRAAWNHHHPKAPLEDQQVVLTVPASFDDTARALTLQAAQLAGLPRLRLLEEPQAAMHDWLFRHRRTLARDLRGVRQVLVVDVGGGTTDLTLLRVDTTVDPPRLQRVAVGPHLMLGGDNMDLALARRLEPLLAAGPAGAAAGSGGPVTAGGATTPEGTATTIGAGSAPAAPTDRDASVAPAASPRLSAAQLPALVERCRAAKEQLLADDAPDALTVTLLGTGSRLVGGARRATLQREQVRDWVVDGFFPQVDADARPQRPRGSALVGLGLPYASDPAVTRHVAAFLRDHADGSLPDALLLNGGVFRAAPIRERLQQVLQRWRGAPVQTLEHPDTDLAVARGAVAFALSQQGRAPGIAAGSPRSYFLLLDDEPGPGPARGKTATADATSGGTERSPAADARPRVHRRATPTGVCVLPQGTEEGRSLELTGQRFALRAGVPVRLHLVSTSSRLHGRIPAAGETVSLQDLALQPLPPLVTRVPDDGPARRGSRGTEIPVHLGATLTELGTLQLQCLVDGDPSRRWSFEFQLRPRQAPTSTGPDDERAGSGDGGARARHPGTRPAGRTPIDGMPAEGAGTSGKREADAAGGRGHDGETPRAADAGRPARPGAGAAATPADPRPGVAGTAPGLAEALTAIEQVFGARDRQADPRAARQLRARLQAVLGDRERWSLAVLRPLADALLERARHRRRSALHERQWLSLLGWCLRPGFGDPLDAWRLQRLWPLYPQGVQHGHDAQVAAEWWTLWRRVAGGLDDTAQAELLQDFALNLRGHEVGLERPPTLVRGGWDDMVRLAGSLERLPPDHKTEVGDWLLGQLGRGRARDRQDGAARDLWTLWALGRLGARAPFHGSAHQVVAADTAARWLARLLALDWRQADGAAAAAAQIARLTGDLARDLSPEWREQVAVRLRAVQAPEAWITRLHEAGALDEAGERGVFGESLPLGLRLLAPGGGPGEPGR